MPPVPVGATNFVGRTPGASDLSCLVVLPDDAGPRGIHVVAAGGSPKWMSLWLPATDVVPLDEAVPKLYDRRYQAVDNPVVGLAAVGNRVFAASAAGAVEARRIGGPDHIGQPTVVFPLVEEFSKVVFVRSDRGGSYGQAANTVAMVAASALRRTIASFEIDGLDGIEHLATFPCHDMLSIVAEPKPPISSGWDGDPGFGSGPSERELGTSSQLIVVGCSGGLLRAYSIHGGGIEYEFRVQDADITAVSWSGIEWRRQVLVGDSVGVVTPYLITTGERLRRPTDLGLASITAVANSVAGDVDGRIRCYNYMNSQAVGPTLSAHTGPVLAFGSAEIPDWRRAYPGSRRFEVLFTLGADGRIVAWDMEELGALKLLAEWSIKTFAGAERAMPDLEPVVAQPEHLLGSVPDEVSQQLSGMDSNDEDDSERTAVPPRSNPVPSSGAALTGSSRSSEWSSMIVALAMMVMVVTIFVIVFEKSGIDSALKAWAALGTIIGVLTGAVPSYFFRRAADQERQRSEIAQERLQFMMGMTPAESVQAAAEARPDLFGPGSEMLRG